MQSLKWILIAMGIFALGSAAISMAPDIRRYARMRAMRAMDGREDAPVELEKALSYPATFKKL
jgi:hypothetical protein